MIRLAANVSLLFAEHPFLERFAQAKAAGFAAVEFHWHRDIDPVDVRAAVSKAGLQVALINFDGGDLSAGDRGVLADPERAGEFRANVPVTLELAGALGCTRLNALSVSPCPASPSRSSWRWPEPTSPGRPTPRRHGTRRS